MTSQVSGGKTQTTANIAQAVGAATNVGVFDRVRGLDVAKTVQGDYWATSWTRRRPRLERRTLRESGLRMGVCVSKPGSAFGKRRTTSFQTSGEGEAEIPPLRCAEGTC